MGATVLERNGLEEGEGDVRAEDLHAKGPLAHHRPTPRPILERRAVVGEDRAGVQTATPPAPKEGSKGWTEGEDPVGIQKAPLPEESPLEKAMETREG